MNNTLILSDTIQRLGYTVIDDVRVVQYTCIIPLNNPKDMRIGISKLNPDMYKANRDVCRNDYATFEDSAYQLQEELLAKIGG
jgi:hypothetical protein